MNFSVNFLVSGNFSHLIFESKTAMGERATAFALLFYTERGT